MKPCFFPADILLPDFSRTDGRRWAVLYIRTNAEGDKINVAEVQDAGWNAVADDKRRRFGMEFGRDRLR